jgi:hypothetical protein
MTTIQHNHLASYGFKPSEGIFMPSEDRPIHCLDFERHNSHLSNRQKPCFKFHSRNEPAQISRNAHKDMNADILYTFEPQSFKAMTSLQDAEESLYSGSHFIDAFEALARSYSLHNILNPIVFLEIKSGTIFTFEAIIFKEAAGSAVRMKSAAELDSSSLGLFTPIAELNAGLAEELSIRAYSYISAMEGILSCSGIGSDIRGDISADKVSCIVGAVVTCIGNHGIDVFIAKSMRRIVGQIRQKLAVPLIAGSDPYRSRKGEFCIGNLKMNLITEKGEIFTLITPCSIIVGPERLDMGRIYGELQTFCLDETEALSNKIDKYFIENLLSEPLSEIMEGIVSGSLAIGKTAQISQSSIESEFLSEISFGGGKAEVNEKKGFKECLRIVSLAPFIAVTIFDKVVDEGKINGVEQYLQGVVGWDDRGKFKVNKIKLPVSFHSKASIWN